MKNIRILDILLLILITYILYLWYKSSKFQSNTNEKFNINNKKSIKNKFNNFNDMFDLTDNLNQSIFDHTKNKHNKKNNNNHNQQPYFMEIQFHNDYRDTITAFNDIAPSQKEIFNQCDLPVNYTNPPYEEVNDLINEFIKQLNEIIKYNIPEYRHSNSGWDEPLIEMKEKSGWDKQQEELGLPKSLYSDPAKKSLVKLIKIDEVQKLVTELETKYICTIIIQKYNVDDQMIVKISFVKNNKNINEDRDFFKDIGADSDCETIISQNSEINFVIEQIFIVGFLTKEGIQKGNHRDNFYHFKGLETNNITDNKTIVKELIKKYKNKNEQDLLFSASLDEQDKLFRDGLRDISTYDAFKSTRTIYDDLNDKPILYE